jgi:SAM-dependent methyltransferase
MSQWAEFWSTSEDYQLEKQNSFNIVNHYLKTPPSTILDIGCGFAFESRMFSKKHNTKIWLLDGDVEENTDNKREIRFGSTESMAFYNKLADIKQVLDQDNIKDYVLLDVNNYTIPTEQKFDLICSWFSCGFHYPIDTYRKLIKDHSHADTKVIVDLRTKIIDKLNVEIVQVLEEGEKHTKAVIKL